MVMEIGIISMENSMGLLEKLKTELPHVLAYRMS